MNIKKLTKRLVSMICCVGCLFGFSTDTFAMETERIAVTQEMRDGITAYVENENGEMEPLDCEISLVKNVSNARTSGNVYTLEVKASENKFSTDSTTQAGITLWGQIVWTDNFGIHNKLLSVSGSYSNSSKLDYAFYSIGGSSNWYHDVIVDIANTNRFSRSESSCEHIGSKFKLYMYGRTKDNIKVSLTVQNSIFD